MPKPGGRRLLLLPLGIGLLPLIAWADLHNANDVPLGLLYLLPMVLLGSVLRPWELLLAAAVATALAERFDPFVWQGASGAERDALYFAAFLSVGLYVARTGSERRQTRGHLARLEEESRARTEAEEQLQGLIESSPAAVLMADADGTILLANGTAHRLLEIASPGLLGRPIQFFFPALATFALRASPAEPLRVVVQAKGHRADGEDFLADVCFARYPTRGGQRMAATILDLSDELRTREEQSLHQMLSGSRIAVGAFSHEVRNICGAISVVHRNLQGLPALGGNADFEALGNLTRALEQLAEVELKPYPEQSGPVDLQAVLDDVRILLGPSLAEAEVDCTWHVPDGLPMVLADRSSLVQIFLNLINNSVRALYERVENRELAVRVTEASGERVEVELADNAGGVANPAELFRPFQAGARSTGLGLYLSRAFARAAGGDLRYRALPGQAVFVLELVAVPEEVL